MRVSSRAPVSECAKVHTDSLQEIRSRAEDEGFGRTRIFFGVFSVFSMVARHMTARRRFPPFPASVTSDNRQKTLWPKLLTIRDSRTHFDAMRMESSNIR